MSVADNFSKLCESIRIKNDDVISYRYRRITKAINVAFWATQSDTAHSLYVGSYGRKTGIKGISDIDMISELPPGIYQRFNTYSGNGQSALLQAVKQAIEKTYSDSAIGADGQVIVVRFTDGTRFEVVPAFESSGSYVYPDSNNGGSWKSTNPRAEISAIRSRDLACNGNLRQLCRMMRAWKSKNSVDISSFLVDTLAYQFMNDWQYRDKSLMYYDWMTRDFLLYLSQRDRTKLYWAAPGSGRYVWRTGTFEIKAKRSYEKSLEAIKYDDDKMPYSASLAWREIFGTDYP